MDLSLLNHETALLMQRFRDIPELRESMVVRALIDKVYHKNVWFFYIYSMIYLLIAVIFSLCTIWEVVTLYLMVPFFVLNPAMLFYEIMVLISDPKRFIAYKWNFVDVFIYPLMVTLTLYHLFIGYEY